MSPSHVASTTRAPVDDELARVLLEEAARAERLERSVPVFAAFSAATALLVLALASFEQRSAVPRSGLAPALLFGALWVAFASATLAYRFAGPTHLITRALAMVDHATRSLAGLGAIALWEPLTMLFLLLGMARGYSFRARPPGQLRTRLVSEVACHVTAAAACLFACKSGTAALIFLALCAFVLAQSMTARAALRTTRVRVDRDLLERTLLALELDTLRGRVARELHDGGGADLLALILQLRRQAPHNPRAAALEQEAQSILEDLRAVVWSLRGRDATLGELGKLLDATCRRRCGQVPYQRVQASELNLRAIETVSALHLLQVAQELVELSATLTQVTRVLLTLGDGGPSTVSLTIEARGARAEQLEQLLGRLTERTKQLTRHQASASGVTISAAFSQGALPAYPAGRPTG